MGENSNWDRLAICVAVVAIVVLFAMIAYYLQILPGIDSTKWSQYLYLIGSVEAVAFAGAGYLWGKEVHREQAQKAETRADIAERTTDQSNERATKAEFSGKAYLHYIEMKAANNRSKAPTYGKLGATDVSDINQHDLDEILEYGKQLFPDT